MVISWKGISSVVGEIVSLFLGFKYFIPVNIIFNWGLYGTLCDC